MDIFFKMEKFAKNVKIWLDKCFIQTTKGSGELLTNLEKLNIDSIIEKLPVENSIFWTRYDSVSIKDAVTLKHFIFI